MLFRNRCRVISRIRFVSSLTSVMDGEAPDAHIIQMEPCRQKVPFTKGAEELKIPFTAESIGRDLSQRKIYLRKSSLFQCLSLPGIEDVSQEVVYLPDSLNPVKSNNYKQTPTSTTERIYPSTWS
ncbi:hypothetical protein NPIL_215961 [Nephila pilipes]|uniref:Uncharacterized protein n=1 Tax=Nephila pilipes TaxID=299642 RepID=A0A8X6TI07_NEPPI|nr:hypothetical protein NPIL_215961 [Nephila pilipes]